VTYVAALTGQSVVTGDFHLVDASDNTEIPGVTVNIEMRIYTGMCVCI